MKERLLLRLWVTLCLVVVLAVALSLAACAAPAPSSTPAPAPAKPAPKEWKLTQQGSPTASSLYVFDIKQAELLSKIPNVTVANIPGNGVPDCFNTLLTGGAQIAMSGPAFLFRAQNGILDFDKKPAGKDIRVLWAYSVDKFTFFATKESGITSLAQTDGKRVGDTASESSFLANNLVEAAGIKPKYVSGTLSAVIDGIKNKQIDAFFKAGAPDSSVQQIEASMPITILPVTKDILDKANAKYPGMFTPSVLAAGTYKDQTVPMPTILNVLSWAATKDVDTDLVYNMAKTLYEKRKEMAAIHQRVETFADWPQLTLDSTSTFLHAGVVKFFQQDLKLTVPARLIPPEK